MQDLQESTERKTRMKTSLDSKPWKGNSHLTRIARSMDIHTGNDLKKTKNSVTSKSCLGIYTNKLCSFSGKPGHQLSPCRLRKKNAQEKSKTANLAKSVERNPGYDGELGFVCREVAKSKNKETMSQS